MKMMAGGDVNTWDIKWCPSYLNQGEDNFRVLEREQNGLARRFVWKILEEETSDVEIWRLYSGYQYDRHENAYRGGVSCLGKPVSVL